MASRRRGPRLERHPGYRMLVGAPVPPQAEAMTLGRLILVRRRSAGHDPLIAHELVHVRQFVELGAPRFLARYVGSYLRGRLAGYGHMAAYRRIPLEVEASWLSRTHSRASLEPGSPANDAPPVSQARSPRPAVAVRLQDEAERITRDAQSTLQNTLPGVVPMSADDAGPAVGPHRGRRRRPTTRVGRAAQATTARAANASTSRRRKRTSRSNR